jgi:hypothetical protein
MAELLRLAFSTVAPRFLKSRDIQTTRIGTMN